MIEITIKHVDGIDFIDKVHILEPDKIWHGIGVHMVSMRVDKQAAGFLNLLGLRKVYFDCNYKAYYYARTPFAYYVKGAEFLCRIYWVLIRWLYDNARIFKQIPEGELFSWRYFTPYVWYKNLRRKYGINHFRNGPK